MQKFNIVLIMTDQQRWDTLGAYGNKVIETPYLDWLASEGTVFNHAYTPSPSCVPARASLLTGMDPWNTGILGMEGGQKPMGINFSQTIPQELGDHGYHTQGIGKMHFFPQRALNGFHNTILDESGRVHDPGFVSDYIQWFEDNKDGKYGFLDHGIDWNSWMSRPYHAPEFLHPTNWTVNESINYLKRRDPSKPFFLKTSFARPHSPYDPPAYYFDLYNNKKFIPTPHVGNWAGENNIENDAIQHNAWRGKKSEEETRRAKVGYYGSITHIDNQIGRLLVYLQDNNIYDETLIIFTSDHGDMLGDHHLWRKTYAYEGSSHIPLIIKPPKSLGTIKERIDEPVVLQDILPTILDVVNIDIPNKVDGNSLLPLMKNEPIEWRKYIHGEHSTCYSEEQEMQFVTDGKIKYIWLPRKNEEQLFDLTRDPYECYNVIQHKEYSEIAHTWKSYLVNELNTRNMGLVDNGELVCQKDKPYLISPKYEERMKDIILYKAY